MKKLPCKGCLSTDELKDFLKGDFLEGDLAEDIRNNASPIICAANSGHPKCLKHVLDALKQKPTKGKDRKELAMAVLLTVLKGHIGCTKTLIKAGADVNMHSDSYCIVEEYRGKEEDFKRHGSCMHLMIQAGLDVHASCKIRNQLLVNAVKHGHIHCIKLLLKEKADANAFPARGRSLLSSALQRTNSEQILEVLLKAGAEVNYVSYEGSALTTATRNMQLKNMLRLIKAGADVNLRDNKGKTALMHACIMGNPFVQGLEMLLRAGADVNATDKGGNIALHYAADAASYACTAMLLKAGSRLNVIDNYFNTPLMLAVSSVLWTSELQPKDIEKLGDVVRLLLKKGALINIDNICRFNALSKHLLCNSTTCTVPSMLLFAAGETLERFMLEDRGMIIPECMLHDELSLKHLSRMAVREHLINIDPHLHLFGRIPKLGLPSLLTEYLLFYMSLDISPKITS